MESRASFKQIGDEFLRNRATNSVETGTIPTPSSAKESNAPANRGMEENTGRGSKNMRPEIMGVTTIEYGSNADAPIVEGFKVHGSN